MTETSGQKYTFLKERIRFAMENGEVFSHDYDAEGRPVFVRASSFDECVAEVMTLVDMMYTDLYYAYASGRALERLLKEKGADPACGEAFARYLELISEESIRFQDYVYEPDPEEDVDE